MCIRRIAFQLEIATGNIQPKIENTYTMAIFETGETGGDVDKKMIEALQKNGFANILPTFPKAA